MPSKTSKVAHDHKQYSHVKVKKDKAAPKNARSAYTFFLEEAYTRIKGEDPSATFGDVSKVISSRWRQMDGTARAPYMELSEKDKERYLAEKEDYVPTQGFGSDGKALTLGKGNKMKRAKKDKNLPKGALSSYIIFCTQMRSVIKAETPDIANTEILKQTGERWRAMTPEQKAPWESLAAQDRERYDEEMAAYHSSH